MLRLQTFVALAIALATGLFALAAATGVTGSLSAGVVIAVLATGLVGWLLRRQAFLAVDESACPRSLRVVSAVATIVALVQLGRLTVFMLDPSQAAYSVVPGSPWYLRHSCLSSYFVAAQAADRTPDLYDARLYSASDDNPATPRKPLTLGRFNVDVYEYPPTFLVLPRPLAILAPDFKGFRMLWFGLNGAVVLLALLALARSLEPQAASRALLLVPLVLAALPTLSTLQIGNVQLLVISVSMLALLLFERGRCVSGGLLLAFATVSKLFPGLLLVYLLVARKWRALAWTVAWCLFLVLLTIVDLGWASFQAFLAHLPGLLGGEAFPAFRNPSATAINYSVPGLVFKLKLFGVPHMSFAASKILGWLYTPLALAAVVLVGLQARRRSVSAAAWLALLLLATLRSPFLPQNYALFPPLWLLTLLVARQPPTARTLSLLGLAWAAMSLTISPDAAFDPRFTAIATGVPQALTLALAVVTLRLELGTSFAATWLGARTARTPSADIAAAPVAGEVV